MPSKQEIYGMKIFILADSKSFLSMEIYLGKQREGPSQKDVTLTSYVHKKG